MTVSIIGAKVILENDFVETDVHLENGKIVAIGEAQAQTMQIDGRGKVLAPALVDIHGDAFERQLMPRPNVFFPMDAALLDTDRQLASNGIATAYHALTLSWEPGLRSIDRGAEFIDGIAANEDRFSIDHRIQLRWETFAFEAIDLMKRVLSWEKTPSIAFNDHTSTMLRPFDVKVQDKLFEHSPDFEIANTSDPRFVTRVKNQARRTGLSEVEYVAMMAKMWEKRDQVQDVIKQVSEIGKAHGAPMLSHDDTQLETREYYRGVGASVAEFPMSKQVAQSARDAGDHIVFGAPNVVRGKSHNGSLTAADMIEDDLCDILASDYFYPAMLAAAGRLVREKRGPIQKMWSLISTGPAKASNLDDRGEISIGKRADLVLLDWPDNKTPAVKATISGGKIAYQSA